jgi:hypothetical protein
MSLFVALGFVTMVCMPAVVAVCAVHYPPAAQGDKMSQQTRKLRDYVMNVLRSSEAR